MSVILLTIGTEAFSHRSQGSTPEGPRTYATQDLIIARDRSYFGAGRVGGLRR